MQKKLLVMSLFIFVITSLVAFDGQRKGFILGGGAGLANVSYSQELEGFGESAESDTESEIAFATDFKIGYAPNNQLEIYYTNQVGWFSMKNIYGDNVTIANALSAIGVSYFIAPELKSGGWHPSLFFSGGLGLSSWNAPMEEDIDSSSGTGFFVGVGYEFTKHYRISLNYFANNPSIKEDGLTLTTNSNVFLLTFSGLAF